MYKKVNTKLKGQLKGQSKGKSKMSNKGSKFRSENSNKYRGNKKRLESRSAVDADSQQS